jgi:hypothetical protein
MKIHNLKEQMRQISGKDFGRKRWPARWKMVGLRSR